jgi:oligopeptide/dipeptide ABC transporter ATP-binding protein
MCARDHTSFIVISHDPKALAGIADRIVVMYAGQFVEQGPAREIFSQPLHPYTHALLQCSLDQPMATSSISNKKRFPFIAGSSPDPLDALPGCCFSPRCPDRMAVCDCRRPTLSAPAFSRMVRCCKYEAS